MTVPLTAGTAVAVPPTYTVTDLGGPTGEYYAANHINASGQASVNGVSGAASWSAPTGFVDLGNLGVLPIVARDINASGQIVGDSGLSSTSPYTHAFLWTPGAGIRDLGTLGGRSSTALAINDSGQVVGVSQLASTESHAFSWTAAGGMVDLGVVGEQSIAMDVNNSGAVIARHLTTAGGSFLWTAGSGTTELPSLGGGSTTATIIGDNGAVIGDSYTTTLGVRHPFVWSAADGIITDLGSLGGSFATATDINASGQIAGRAYRPDGVEHAFFWSLSTGMIDLPTLGGAETEAAAINDSGAVVGYTTTPLTDEHAFVWTQADGMTDLGTGDAIDVNNNGQIAGTRELPDFSRHAAVWQLADANANGIEDGLEVAGQPGAFRDANTPLPTYGSIVNANGHIVTIVDAPAPDGVRITVSGTGALRATFSVCGMTLTLAPGSNVVATCGSLTVGVAAGAAEIVVGGGRIVVTVPAGATVKVSDIGGGQYRVDNLGATGDVTVSVDGNPSLIAAGQTTTVSTGDRTPPQVVCAGIPTFIVGQPGAFVSASVSDAGSGPAAATVSAAANTGLVGTFTVNVTGSDLAGNSTTVGCSYRVTYRFEGFSAPIDNLPTINVAKAGQTIPVKWRLTNFQGAGIADPASFLSVTSVSGTCSSAAPFDAVEVYSGNSGLRYLGNGWWQFNWKTPTSYAGLCREMRLNLADGSARAAGFTFN